LKLLRFAWLLLLPLIPWTQVRIDERLGRYRAQRDVLYLWSAKHVRRLFPGFEDLAADVYWLRTVQYFGGQRHFGKQAEMELLYPLIEITTTLDPRLEMAYRYGATFLSEPWPIGAGRPREGVAVLERGVAALPRSWRLRQDLGFFHHLFLHDTQRAAEVIREAGQIPGAPTWLMDSVAADILLKGGDRASSRRMWQQMYEQAEEGILRNNAKVRLQIFEALDQADALTAQVAEHERRAGRRPASLQELRAAVGPRVLLADSTGVPFHYDPSSGRVTISRSSILWRP
jgi:hypothetical protein